MSDSLLWILEGTDPTMAFTLGTILGLLGRRVGLRMVGEVKRRREGGDGDN